MMALVLYFTKTQREYNMWIFKSQMVNCDHNKIVNVFILDRKPTKYVSLIGCFFLFKKNQLNV